MYRKRKPDREHRKIRARADRADRTENGRRRAVPPYYSVFRFTPARLMVNILFFTLLDAAVSFLFYRSFRAFLILFPFLYFFLKERKKDMIRTRNRRMNSEFLTGMKFVSTSLQAGYAPENAFREACREVRRIYPEDSFIVTEFSRIVTQTSLNVPLEALLTDLGRRSGVEEIRDFGEVFAAARRTGGDLVSIVRNTVSGIEQKEETMMEIETVLTGRQFEQRIMSVVPLGILSYVSLTSPDMIAAMYGNTPGILIMTVALTLYAAAFLWARKIMTIEV